MKNWQALLLLISLSLLLLYFIFGDVMLHPAQYLFGSIEDGTKNYYTAAYFVKFDHGVWFTGMNYPFGEHITYTDNQPLFSVLLNAINNHITPVSAYTIGVFNCFMLYGLVLCAVFLYLILAEIKLPRWYAVLLAIIIAFLSPQLFRIRAHYALGYTFIIPMFWYFIIRIFKQPKALKWYVIYAVTGLLMVLVHPYYALLNLLLLLSSLLVYYFQEKKTHSVNYRLIIRVLIAVLVPLVLFQLYMHFTDPVTDRPESPYGFTAYRTSFKALFFPLEAPLLPVWQAVFGSKEMIWEGYAYVGQAAFIVLIFSLVKVFKYARKKSWKLIFRPVLPAPLRIGIWAAVLVLIFALAVPIRWGLEGILDIIPPLKQFRSIGRFAWIFYYVFSVYAAYYLFRLFRYLKLRRKPTLAYVLVGGLLAFWGFEALNNPYQKALSIKQNRLAEAFTGPEGNYEQLLNRYHYTPAEFQAIFPLPYFNVGSEKITLFRNPEIANEVMKASLNTGLPIAANLLSRTSLTQSYAQLQLLSSYYTPKKILTAYPNQKPLLLIVVNDSLGPAEANLVKKAQLITHQARVSLYKLPLDSLQAKNHLALLPAGLSKQQHYFVSNTNGPVIRKSFINNAENGFFEKGALPLDSKQTTILDTVITIPNSAQPYELSLWAYGKIKNLPQLKLQLSDQNGKLLSEKSIFFNATTEILNDWLNCSYTFNLPAGRVKLTLTSKTKKALVDDLLLRPVDTDVYFYGAKPQILIKNNLQL